MMWATTITLALSALVSLRMAIRGARTPTTEDVLRVAGFMEFLWFGALAYAIWERIP